MDCELKTLIDQRLELIDPTPNIHKLFVQFNERFFWNVLLPVEVKWSNKMTSCAGICSYDRRNKQCVITLSAPLLKLRPRKDLVETLLHEMIHGYLFLTNNNRDRDGHGPEFCRHMHRINNEAGTRITIYHDFHEEVRLYKQHWWRCDGPCQKKAPYFGTVRRAMNRAPGPSDYWWKSHLLTCGGQFVKIREPEKVNTKNVKSYSKVKSVTKGIANKENILTWLIQKGNTSAGELSKNDTLGTSVDISSNGTIKRGGDIGEEHLFKTTDSTGTRLFKSHSFNPSSDLKNISKDSAKIGVNYSFESFSQTDEADLHTDAWPKGIRKLGSSANNVHGWSNTVHKDLVAERVGSCKSLVNKKDSTPKFSYSGTLGGNPGKSNLLQKFYSNNEKIDKTIKTISASAVKRDNSESTLRAPKNIGNGKNINFSDEYNSDLISCPVCDIYTHRESINEHLDVCLQNNYKGNKSVDNNESNAEPLTGMMQQQSILKNKRSPVATLPAKRAKTDELEQLNIEHVCCPICYETIELGKINDHIDNSHLRNKSEDNATKPFNNCDREKEHTVHKCFVCGRIITAEISLNEHLEECIGNVFDDKSNDIFNSVGESSVNKMKYPCPACMELQSLEFMNEHLDKCLMT